MSHWEQSVPSSQTAGVSWEPCWRCCSISVSRLLILSHFKEKSTELSQGSGKSHHQNSNHCLRRRYSLLSQAGMGFLGGMEGGFCQPRMKAEKASPPPVYPVPEHDSQPAPGVCCPTPARPPLPQLARRCWQHICAGALRGWFAFLFSLASQCQLPSRACKPNYTPSLDCLTLEICREVIYDTNYQGGGGWRSMERKLIYIKCNQFPE